MTPKHSETEKKSSGDKAVAVALITAVSAVLVALITTFSPKLFKSQEPQKPTQVEHPANASDKTGSGQPVQPSTVLNSGSTAQSAATPPAAKKVEPSNAGLRAKSAGAPSVKAANEVQKASDLSDKAQWLLGKWRMYFENGNRGKVCDQLYTFQSKIEIGVENGQIVGHLNADAEGKFPNNVGSPEICQEERRWALNYSLSLSFVVVDIDAQSAKLKLVGEMLCDRESDCEQLRRGQELGWHLDLRPNGKLAAIFHCGPLPDGVYSK
ncbi:MAG TPA: hypothetical protein VJP02_17835 [Candidatus Sulfotelmatobacter sp.]|nr:hypothetical protein [Candidatus Sulfotelmatobacter sp.]